LRVQRLREHNRRTLLPPPLLRLPFFLIYLYYVTLFESRLLGYALLYIGVRTLLSYGMTPLVKNRGKTPVTCTMCSRVFYVKPSRLRLRATKYCTRECYGIGKKLGKNVFCRYCGDTFYVGKYEAARGKGLFCSPQCASMSRVGSKRPTIRGENNSNWQGGVSKLQILIRKSKTYLYWRKQIFERDNYVCQNVHCAKRGGLLTAHHIVPLNMLLEQYNIKSMDEAVACQGLWRLENGRTLCKDCHNKLHKQDGYTFM
jgi:5-methylcytosine-specific restriction endonuclease McrA